MRTEEAIKRYTETKIGTNLRHRGFPELKLLGIEVTNYARFEKQFIPLDQGINLLVGRNNSGKTALLTAASSLARLPIYEEAPMISPGNEQPEALAYGHARIVEFDLLFSSENENDPRFLDGPTWKSFVTGTHVLYRYSFELLPGQASAWLRSVSAQVNRIRYLILEWDQNTLVRRMFDPDGTEIGKTNQGMGGAVAEGGRLMSSSLPRDDVFRQLYSLPRVVFIQAHRVVTDDTDLRAAYRLKQDAENLGPFLQRLQGDDPPKYLEIQKFLIDLFPEFEYINLVPSMAAGTHSATDRLKVQLTLRDPKRKIPLPKCGTGVEQALVLAAFVLASEPGLLFLIHEPHSFLHPTAERQLVSFLKAHPEHRYLISTHSSVFINAVAANRLTLVQPPGTGYSRESDEADRVADVLYDLGCRNSDMLFPDRLVFVEGDSDAEILPILLSKPGLLSASQVATIGFPEMRGSTDKLEDFVLRYERILQVMGSARLPRLYLFDGDKKANPSLKKLQGGTLQPQIKFLSRPELEDFLLDPDAIWQAISEEVELADPEVKPSKEVFTTEFERIMQARTSQRNIKGSDVLEMIYGRFLLTYRKTQSGRLIAKYTGVDKNSSIQELLPLIAPLFN